MAALTEPKRPLSAYFLYNNENREKVQKELGVKDFGPVTKTLSERWKNLPANVKASFDKKAADAKAQYDKDLAAFKEAGGVRGEKRKAKLDAKEHRAAKKAKQEANAGKPKSPAGGAFGVFLADNRAAITKNLPAGSAITAVAKAASEGWKALSEKQRAPYEAKYQEKKAKYQEELEAWKATKATNDDDEDDDDDDDKEN